MADTILAVAVNKAGVKSEPFKVYMTKATALRGQFVMKVSDGGINDKGDPQTRLGNFSLNLIVTHGTAYIDERITGFRRKVGDDVFIMCEKFSEDMADKKAMAEAEEF